VRGLNAGALLDATDRDFTYTAFHYQVEKHNNDTSSAFKLDKYEKQLSDIGDNFQLIRAGRWDSRTPWVVGQLWRALAASVGGEYRDLFSLD